MILFLQELLLEQVFVSQSLTCYKSSLLYGLILKYKDSITKCSGKETIKHSYLHLHRMDKGI